MIKEDIKNMIGFLQNKINIKKSEEDDEFVILFEDPTHEEMLNAGINPKLIDAALKSSWWEEMVTDIAETPEFCDPEAGEEEVLDYARDVVSEYIAKRIEI